ncbi:MAG: tRNA 5-methylaminomethyl-2-thiouridine biosynthesis protein MnmC, partial [Caulobacteraceae bacterium]|nr:tRNA 5-methylaminomethyl-2-thiouridine biosynthesis protein MnmC [Caulobacteraceae bacterium]
YRRALDLYAALPAALIARGAVVLEAGPRDAGRFDKIVGSDLFEPGEVRRLTGGEATARLGEPVGAGLSFASAPTIEPLCVLETWCGEVLTERVESLEPGPGQWSVILAGGGRLDVEQVVVASGPDTRRLVAGLPLQPVRGQVAVAAGIEAAYAASFGGYVAPARDGLLFGSTFDRDDEDETPRFADRAHNLRQVASTLPELAARLSGAPIQDRASIRAAMPDRMPLAGEAQPGLFILSGLGSHGFCLAPLLAEAVAAQASGFPSPLPRDLAELVDPKRYLPPRHGHG